MGPRICAVVFLLLGLLQPVALGQRQQRDGALYRWGGEQWVQVDGYGVRVSVAPDGAAWVVNSQNEIYHFVNGRSIDYRARLPTSVSAATAPRGSSALTATSTDGLTTIGSACPEPALPSASIDRDRLGSSTQQTKSIGGPGAHSNAYPGWRATSGLKTRSGSSAPTARFTVSTLASGLPPGAWPCVSALARTGRPGW